MIPNYLQTYNGCINVQLIETAYRLGDISYDQLIQFRNHYQNYLPELRYPHAPSLQDLQCRHRELQQKIYAGIRGAESRGKKLLILIGEEHSNRKCLLTEKIALFAAKQLGINTLLTELCCQKEIKRRKSQVQKEPPYKVNVGYMHLFAEEKLGMEILPCDPLYACGGDRDRAMCAAIAKVKKNCVCVVGTDHMQRIQNDPAIRNNYELIYINSLDEPVSYNPHMLLPNEMTDAVMHLGPVSTPSKLTILAKKLFSFFTNSACPAHK